MVSGKDLRELSCQFPLWGAQWGNGRPQAPFLFRPEVAGQEKYQKGKGWWGWPDTTHRPPPKTYKVILLHMVPLCIVKQHTRTLHQGKQYGRESDAEEVAPGIQKHTVGQSSFILEEGAVAWQYHLVEVPSCCVASTGNLVGVEGCMDSIQY